MPIGTRRANKFGKAVGRRKISEILTYVDSAGHAV
jgi:hypothetical protein